MAVKFTVKKYIVGGVHMNVAEAGKGKPLVFIHGWSNNWQGWTLLAQELAPRYSIFLLDLPGFGDSDRLAEYSIDIEADIVAQFIKQYVPEPEAIIGASLGTIIAAHALIRHPELSKRIILLGAVFRQLNFRKAFRIGETLLRLSGKSSIGRELVALAVKNTLTAYTVERFLNAYKFNKKLIDAYSLPGRKKITGRSYVQLGISARQFRMEDFLTLTTAKTLLVYGEKEKYVRPVDAIKLLTAIQNPNVGMRIIAKAGHNLAYEQPEQTASVMRDFLEGTTTEKNH